MGHQLVNGVQENVKRILKKDELSFANYLKFFMFDGMLKKLRYNLQQRYSSKLCGITVKEAIIPRILEWIYLLKRLCVPQ